MQLTTEVKVSELIIPNLQNSEHYWMRCCVVVAQFCWTNQSEREERRQRDGRHHLQMTHSSEVLYLASFVAKGAATHHLVKND